MQAALRPRRVCGPVADSDLWCTLERDHSGACDPRPVVWLRLAPRTPGELLLEALAAHQRAIKAMFSDDTHHE